MKAINVAVISEYKIKVTFDDGVSGVVDLHDFIEKGIFSALKDKQLFNKAYTTGYSIAWNEDLEVDAIAIYAEIINEKSSFIEKFEKGLKDIENGSVLKFNDARQTFLAKLF